VDGIITTGKSLTVILAVVLLQPVVPSVNVKVTIPDATAVTLPELSIVAKFVSLLAQVPPVFGVRSIVAPTQMLVEGTLTTGSALTVMLAVALLQLVAVDVNVKVTIPAAIAVTFPELSTVAKFVSLLAQVPPVFGVRSIVAPTQILVEGAVTTGRALTVILAVVLVQLVVPSVNVKVTLPVATAVTFPELSTVAIFVSLLAQVPPVLGVRSIVAPMQILVEGALTTGSAFTVILEVVLVQVVVPSVKVKVTVPAATAVTFPELSIVATFVSLLAHVPPVFGVKSIVAPTHILVEGALTTGRVYNVIVVLSIAVIPLPS
jgi:hypothetical protein